MGGNHNILVLVECPFLHLFIGYDDYLKKAKFHLFVSIGNTKWKLNSVIHHTTYSSLCPVNDMKGDTFSTTSSRYSRPQEILDHSCSLFLK